MSRCPKRLAILAVFSRFYSTRSCCLMFARASFMALSDRRRCQRKRHHMAPSASRIAPRESTKTKNKILIGIVRIPEALGAMSRETA